MSLRNAESYTMEALAVVSALCILAIFLFSHYSRQVDDLDHQAQRLARRAVPVAQEFFQQNPDGRLSLELLRQAGWDVPQPFQARIPEDQDRADNWRIEIWHPQGAHVYLASPQGVSSRPR